MDDKEFNYVDELSEKPSFSRDEELPTPPLVDDLPEASSPSLVRSSNRHESPSKIISAKALPLPPAPIKKSINRMLSAEQRSRVCPKLEDDGTTKNNRKYMVGKRVKRDQNIPLELIKKEYSVPYFEKCLNFLTLNPLRYDILLMILDWIPLLIKNPDHLDKLGLLFHVSFINMLYRKEDTLSTTFNRAKKIKSPHELMYLLANGLISGDYGKYGETKYKFSKIPLISLTELLMDYKKSIISDDIKCVPSLARDDAPKLARDDAPKITVPQNDSSYNPQSSCDNILSYYYDYLVLDTVSNSSSNSSSTSELLFRFAMNNNLDYLADDLYRTMCKECTVSVHDPLTNINHKIVNSDVLGSQSTTNIDSLDISDQKTKTTIPVPTSTKIYDKWKRLNALKYTLIYPKYHHKFVNGFSRGRYANFPGLLDILKYLGDLLPIARRLITDELNKKKMLIKESLIVKDRMNKYLYE
ncbi:MAG: hypothetical protein Solumvirus2_39 [Solumvirus sp.]|uniref:Uncharacterized protein n=1 Tax=Solumvirus sp. TaxID=2487773 RepID=A0A3G5AGD3_9VIRU|nr:MAG: hypothetical protein Solumvirus2_39 [Solumvirus sp.]